MGLDHKDSVISYDRALRSAPLRARSKAPVRSFPTRPYTSCHVTSSQLSSYHIHLLLLYPSFPRLSFISQPISSFLGSFFSHQRSLYTGTCFAPIRALLCAQKGRKAVEVEVWEVKNGLYLGNGKSNRPRF